MVTKRRNLVTEFTRILETHGIIDELLVGQLVGVAEVVYTKKPRADKKKTDARSQPLVVQFQSHVGYPLANFALEIKWADWMFAHGFTSEQILACYDEMKRGWWSDKKVSLYNVADKIGEFVKRNSTQAGPAAPTAGANEYKRQSQATIDLIFSKPENHV